MKLPSVPSDGFLKALPQSERKRLGRVGMGSAEAQEKYRAGQEKRLQNEIANWLLLKGHYFECDRMDRRTSGKCGRADFRCCIAEKWLSIECKTDAGTLSDAQARQAARLRKSGGRFVLAFCLQDVLEAVRDLTGK